MYQCSHTLLILVLFFSATNAENKDLNNVKNQLTGEFGGVPDTARYYKVNGSFRVSVFDSANVRNSFYSHVRTC